MKKVIINGVRILKKGVKGPDGKYCPAWFSRGLNVKGVETITIYAKSLLKGLPKELAPVNGTDIMTDYFEKDRARFSAGTDEFQLLAPFCAEQS